MLFFFQKRVFMHLLSKHISKFKCSGYGILIQGFSEYSWFQNNFGPYKYLCKYVYKMNLQKNTSKSQKLLSTIMHGYAFKASLPNDKENT